MDSGHRTTLSDDQVLESAQDWLGWFRESANPQTTEERWTCLDAAATHLELVLGVLERLLPDAE